MVLATPFFAMLVFGLAWSRTIVSFVLERGVIVRLGEASHSFHLLHTSVLAMFLNTAGDGNHSACHGHSLPRCWDWPASPTSKSSLVVGCVLAPRQQTRRQTRLPPPCGPPNRCCPGSRVATSPDSPSWLAARTASSGHRPPRRGSAAMFGLVQRSRPLA